MAEGEGLALSRAQSELRGLFASFAVLCELCEERIYYFVAKLAKDRKARKEDNADVPLLARTSLEC